MPLPIKALISVIIGTLLSCAIASAQGLLIDQIVQEPDKENATIDLMQKDTGSSKSGWEQLAEHKDWRILCNGQSTSNNKHKTCKLEPTATANPGSEHEEIRFKFVINKMRLTNKGKLELVSVITTPFGLSLASGLSISVDEKRPYRYAYRSCHIDEPDQTRAASGHCLVTVRLSEPILTALKRGNIMKISAVDLFGKTKSQTFSLSGITAALEQLP